MDSDQRRGTNGWAVDELLKRGLKKLIQDLIKLENEGFEEEICIQVKGALRRLTIAGGPASGATFAPEIIMQSDRFHERYAEWNGQGKKTNDKAARIRRGSIHELYFWRAQMLEKMYARRKGYYGYVTDDDFAVIQDVYEQLGVIVAQYPEIFYNLKKSVLSFRAGVRARAQIMVHVQ